MNQAARLGRVVAGGLCLCGILLAAGCGGGKGEVHGKVLYQGKPVPGGNVFFALEGGGVTSSPIDVDGSYTIRNISPGTVKITVETESLSHFGKMGGGKMGGGNAGGPPELMQKYSEKTDVKEQAKMTDPEQAKRYVPIPTKYGDPDKSKLTYVVKSGKQEHDIDLK